MGMDRQAGMAPQGGDAGGPDAVEADHHAAPAEIGDEIVAPQHLVDLAGQIEGDHDLSAASRLMAPDDVEHPPRPLVERAGRPVRLELVVLDEIDAAFAELVDDGRRLRRIEPDRGFDAPLPSERDLMEEFGVSRLTVREAIAALQSRGMVTTRPGTRARVSAPQPDFLLSMLSQAATYHLAQPGGLTSLMQVRLIVETGTARIAAEKADDQAIAELKATLERNRAAMDDVAAFGRTDIEFHAAIARIVGNPMIDAFFAAVSEWLNEVRNTSLQTPGQTERAFEAHVRVFAAIEARDPMAASEEMSRHLTQLAGVYPPTQTAAPRHDEDR